MWKDKMPKSSKKRDLSVRSPDDWAVVKLDVDAAN